MTEENTSKQSYAPRILGAVGIYAAASIVTFGAVAASQRDICEERARDPLKCRVQIAAPAALFWPLAVAYAVGDQLSR